MKKNLFYAIAIALCGVVCLSSCTKDYDDDLRIQRELIENNEKELRATINAYQVLVENALAQMEIAYKNADDLIKQEMKAEFDAAKTRLTALEAALAAAEQNISTLQIDLQALKAAVEIDFQRVNAHIEAINQRIDDADKKIAALDTRLTAAETAINDLKAWKTLAEAKLAELEAGQNANKAEIEALKQRIAATEAQIAAMETKLEELKTAMNTADDALNARIDDLTAQLGAQVTSLTSLITSVQTALTDKINDFKTEMTRAFDEYRASIDADLAEMASDLARVIADVYSMTSSLAALSGQVGDLETKVAELTAKIAGLASAADLAALTTKVNDLIVSLAEKEAVLKVLINANKDNIKANKEAIEALKAQIAALKSELEQKIIDAVADKVTYTAMDAALAQLEEDYLAADAALQALIDVINNTTIPALKSRMDTIEADIAALKNRIQALKWVPSYMGGALTLKATADTTGTAYESALLSEELYIVCAESDIVKWIVDSTKGYTVEVIANKASTYYDTRSIIDNPFENIVVAEGVDGTLKIEMSYADRASLWTSFYLMSYPTATGIQLAVKISDDKGNTAMTDFADVVIENQMPLIP